MCSSDLAAQSTHLTGVAQAAVSRSADGLGQLDAEVPAWEGEAKSSPVTGVAPATVPQEVAAWEGAAKSNPLTGVAQAAVSRSADGLGQLDAEVPRSEEHTSELQSQAYLVCRLLLEKKKTRISDSQTGSSTKTN